MIACLYEGVIKAELEHQMHSANQQQLNAHIGTNFQVKKKQLSSEYQQIETTNTLTQSNYLVF